MRYFSVFSGIGGFEKAIQDVFPNALCVGYSEIDKYAVKVYQQHFPTHRNFGDITKINVKSLPDFDLLVGGSPCQDLSIAKNQRQGLEGNRSSLFYKYLETLRIKKPRFFLFENVASMHKKDRDIITKELGVEPVMIDAALVSAQSRKRLFWCNWKVEQPKDRRIFLKDVLENGYTDREKSYPLTATYAGACVRDYFLKHQRQLIFKVPVNKIPKNLKEIKPYIRKLTPIECEKLQSFPINWTKGVSNTQRYRLIGNAVNVEVIKHILRGIGGK